MPEHSKVVLEEKGLKTYMTQPTPFALHVKKWEKGCGARECKTAQNVCFARGDVPADVLLVGEAPGESEDALGLPFVGPAGELLDAMLAEAYRDGRLGPESTPRVCVANVVGCIPRAEDGKADEPTWEQIESCTPRLAEMIMLADGKDPRGKDDLKYMNAPGTLKLIVLLGRVSQDAFDPKYKSSLKPHRQIRTVNLYHPAFIIRLNVAQKGLEIQKSVVRLYNHWLDALEEYRQRKASDEADA
jgi:uracil-DNA glycosylase family 4